METTIDELKKKKRKDMTESEKLLVDLVFYPWRRKKRKKLSMEENRARNAAMPARNKYVEAARRHQGSFIVYDPNFM